MEKRSHGEKEEGKGKDMAMAMAMAMTTIMIGMTEKQKSWLNKRTVGIEWIRLSRQLIE